ncbi:MAG: multiheme c-type cytochrome [Desulfobacterales bacterium]
MRKGFAVSAMLLILLTTASGWCEKVPVSSATQDCLDCHESIHPGIVQDWLKSRHAAITPGQALTEKNLSLKVSSKNVPKQYLNVAVGCAECHTGRTKTHADTFDHNDYDVHTVVSPNDCAVCHSQEAEQYSKNIMSYAFTNLDNNLLYQDLQHSILGKPIMKDGALILEQASAETREEACYYCHGTKIQVKGSETRDTVMGEMEFPVLAGWPNQGVGRVNPDDSRGSCAACHTRHAFSIEMARKPYTCKECHVGPDVPAFKVYSSSKHGNIFSSLEKNYNFSIVPWTIGEDFQAPTCAACHISLLTNTDGEVVAERTHTVSNRLSWRIFGLIYAHPQPKDPDTTKIRNKSNLPLPTDFEGGFASDFLIDKDEMTRRTNTMQGICLSCHAENWVESHWARYENTIKETNDKTRTATQLMLQIWDAGYAKGPSLGKSPWDEAVEKKWADVWLFFSNTTRFASAMGGGGDYGVFADGRYHINDRIAFMKDWLDSRKRIEELSNNASMETKKKQDE